MASGWRQDIMVASRWRQDSVRIASLWRQDDVTRICGHVRVSMRPLGLILTRRRLHIKDKMLYRVQT